MPEASEISVGRSVHIGMVDGQSRPMVVTAVFGERVNGTIFLDGANDTEGNDKANVPVGINVVGPYMGRGWSLPYSPEFKPGHWSWPPRN